MYQYFLSWIILFGVISEKSSQTQDHLGFLMLSSVNYIVLCITFRSMIHLELTFLKGMKSVFDFFWWGHVYISVVSAPFHWKTVLSTLNCFLFQGFDYICMDLFPGYFVPLNYLSFSSYFPVQHFDYYSFSSSIQSGYISSPTLFFFSVRLMPKYSLCILT